VIVVSWVVEVDQICGDDVEQGGQVCKGCVEQGIDCIGHGGQVCFSIFVFVICYALLLIYYLTLLCRDQSRPFICRLHFLVGCNRWAITWWRTYKNFCKFSSYFSYYKNANTVEMVDMWMITT